MVADNIEGLKFPLRLEFFPAAVAAAAAERLYMLCWLAQKMLIEDYFVFNEQRFFLQIRNKIFLHFERMEMPGHLCVFTARNKKKEMQMQTCQKQKVPCTCGRLPHINHFPLRSGFKGAQTELLQVKIMAAVVAGGGGL